MNKLFKMKFNSKTEKIIFIIIIIILLILIILVITLPLVLKSSNKATEFSGLTSRSTSTSFKKK